MNDYYVYVYIDPRNLEEFYYGKGRGGRKDAHLTGVNDSSKSKRIAAIRKAGLDPIVRVVARDLSEHDALLVEKTLLWKLGRHLTNVSSGHYAEKFRPHDTFHQMLSGFDFKRGFFYYNVGEGPHRNWDDYVRLGFISGGQGTRWRDAMLSFNQGDVIAAYLKRCGFVGIGTVMMPAMPIRQVKVKGKPLLHHALCCPTMSDNLESDELCEYVALVRWATTVDRAQARWKPNAGLYTTTHVRASLDAQPKTVAFLESEFEISIQELLLDDNIGAAASGYRGMK